MSNEYIEKADICIFVTEAGRSLNEEEKQILKMIEEKPSIMICNKTDLADNDKEGYISVSAKENLGIEKIKEKISEIIGKGSGKALIANERQYEAVVKALESLEKAKKTVDDGFFSDLAAIDLHDAVAYLGEAEGISINQETVNRIFEKFCLGK